MVYCFISDFLTHRKNFIFLTFLLSVLLLFFFLPQVHCAQVTLAWDPVSVSNLSGYKIYYGLASRSYQSVSDVGNVTTYTLSGLTAGKTYYAAATAYISSGLESTYSNEVTFTVPNACTYTITPLNASFSASGGTGNVSVTTQTSCSWTAASSVPWIIVNSSSVVGSGTVSYTVSPNNNSASQLGNLTIAGNTFTVSQVGKSPAAYTITASAGSGGAISPSGQISVNSGVGKVFTITPNTGYKISNVTIDGVSKGAIASYTFSNVQSNHTINATFSVIAGTTRNILISTNGTGSGSVSTNPSIAAYPVGTVVTLTAIPSASSFFSGWSGACSGTSPICQVIMNSNLTVIATFQSNISAKKGNHDFNGDGLSDLLWWNKLSGAVGVWFMNGTTPNGTKEISSGMNLNWEMVGTGDFDGDSQIDILWHNKVSGDVWVWLMNGTNIKSSPIIFKGMDLNWSIGGTGDFNKNGQTDILWRNKVSGDVAVWLMNGTSPVTGQLIYSGLDLNWEITGTGDFNNDGSTDILLRNKVTGDIVVWLMNGPALNKGQVISSGVDLNWEIAGTGDFNKDGSADILWRNKVTGDVAVWLMNGIGLIRGQVITQGMDLNWILKNK
jgi:hypothetical protein